jgi:predicted HTH transcriptional regulator
MFPSRLSEVIASEVQAVIEAEAAETIDFELKRTLPAKKASVDPWMNNGKLGDDAKDELAAEIIAFANTVGGTLIVGIDEDTATKRAKLPLFPIPRCKEAAARLHQAISDRVEPKLPVFECEGIVTEEDGASGVIIMRTLESYLAPHPRDDSAKGTLSGRCRQGF